MRAVEIPKLKKIIEKTLNQNKAKDITAIDLKGKTSIADYMVIASGTSSKHIQSLLPLKHNCLLLTLRVRDAALLQLPR